MIGSTRVPPESRWLARSNGVAASLIDRDSFFRYFPAAVKAAMVASASNDGTLHADSARGFGQIDSHKLNMAGKTNYSIYGDVLTKTGNWLQADIPISNDLRAIRVTLVMIEPALSSLATRARLGPKLRAYDETHDQVQEAVIDVLTSGPRFEVAHQDRFRALLGRIVENNLHDRNRWLQRERRDIARNRPLASDTVLHLDPPAWSVTRPSQLAERQERQQAEAWGRLAIELLEPRDRDVLWMRDFDEMTFEEIGSHFGVSANAARMRHRKALPRLAYKVRDLMRSRFELPSPESPRVDDACDDR